MSQTVTDTREILVDDAYSDVRSRPVDAFQVLFKDKDEMLQGAESLQIASSATVTINRATSGTPDTNADDVILLTADRPLSAFINLPQRNLRLNMGGNPTNFGAGPLSAATNAYVKGRLVDLFNSLFNARAEDAMKYLSRDRCWTSAANTYWDNVEGDPLNRKDILKSRAAIMAQDGAHDVALCVHPWGTASIMAIEGFQPWTVGTDAPNVGMSRIGTIAGVSVYECNSIGYDHYAVCSVAASSSGTFTLTVPAGHGFVVGEPIYTTLLDTNVPVTAPVTITVATATSIQFVYGTGTDSDLLTTNPAAGRIYSAGVQNIMCDRNHLFRTAQIEPNVTFVPKGSGQTDWEAQALHFFGVLARVGRVRVLNSPRTDI